jgi:hypothetical protein
MTGGGADQDGGRTATPLSFLPPVKEESHAQLISSLPRRDGDQCHLIDPATAGAAIQAGDCLTTNHRICIKLGGGNFRQKDINALVANRDDVTLGPNIERQQLFDLPTTVACRDESAPRFFELNFLGAISSVFQALPLSTVLLARIGQRLR